MPPLTGAVYRLYLNPLTPDGSYTGTDSDNALIITYARDIDGDDTVEATRDQWQAQGILQQEPQIEAPAADAKSALARRHARHAARVCG